MLYYDLYFIIQVLFIFSILFCSFVNNSLYSVLFLILTFFNASLLLFFYGIDFFGIIFLMIYVGAIAILFLFIVMLLEIKQRENVIEGSEFLLFLIFNLIVGAFVKGHLMINFNKDIIIYNKNFLYEAFLFDYTFDKLNLVQLIGQTLYSYFLNSFFLLGFILIIPILSVIQLTLQIRNKKKEIISRKMSRSRNILILINSID